MKTPRHPTPDIRHITMAEASINSILGIDCGSATTTVALIEQINGISRLAGTAHASSTYASPWQDMTVGMLQAVRELEKVVGRTLFNSGGWPITPQNTNRQGIDAIVIVSSAGPPLPVVLAGLMKNISLASARRAAATTYACVVNELSLDIDPSALANSPLPSGSPRNGRLSPESQLQLIQEGHPEVIVLVGGIDGGAKQPVIDLARIVAMALQMPTLAEKPTILYAGNSETREQVAEILGPVAPLRAVPNIRPTLEIENLAAIQMERENLFVQQKMSQLPASKSLEKVIAYLGRHNNLNVLGANIGSSATTISVQAGDYQNSTIRSDAGVGHSLAYLLKVVPLEKFQRWLPFELAPEELRNRLLNKCLHPTSIPETVEDLLIEHAVAREVLRLVMEQVRDGWSLQPTAGTAQIQWNLIVGGGGTLTRAPQLGYAALVMLDGLEPWGVTSLALDSAGVANMLGSIAALQPLAAVEVAAHDAFLNLGTVIAPLGHGTPGKTALKVKVSYASGHQVETEVAYGSLQVIALPPGAKATLEIRPARHFDIGLGQPGRGA
ncbi:MAG: glutamate mutase L, partial [Chloroflexi bacterium]|nr:glutamate mutase L [Chloroflexota bacterium]